MATNLEFIKSASGTSVTSFDITDCFSTDYDVYFGKLETIGGSSGIKLRYLDTSDNPITSSIYDFAGLQMFGGSSFIERRSTGQDAILKFGEASSNGTNAEIYFFNPYDSSSYTFTKRIDPAIYSSAIFGEKAISVAKQTATYTGVRFFTDNGSTMTSINFSVYGVK